MFDSLISGVPDLLIGFAAGVLTTVLVPEIGAVISSFRAKLAAKAQARIDAVEAAALADARAVEVKAAADAAYFTNLVALAIATKMDELKAATTPVVEPVAAPVVAVAPAIIAPLFGSGI